MIVASRRLPSTTRNQLHPKLKLSRLVVTSHPSAVMESPQSSPSASLSTGTTDSDNLNLKEWPSDLFTGESKARAISLLSTDRDNNMFSFKKYGKSCKKAAVLVPFCYDTQGRPGILYNMRSEKLSNHRGEISFPGGTFEPDDKNDPITAALRETHEELGITTDQWDVWTTCRVFPTVSSKMGVIPVVGFLKTGPIDAGTLNICPDEVDHAFVVSLEHLCNTSNWSSIPPPGTLGRNSSFTIPAYKNLHEVTEKLEDIPLWGLTAFITHLVLTAFVPEKYKREVSFIQLMLEDTDKKEANKGSSTTTDCTKSKSDTNSKL